MAIRRSRIPEIGGRAYRALPTGIWVLGFGSLLMDASSELIHSLLPIFMVSVLGAPMLAIGVIEGFAEAKIFLEKSWNSMETNSQKALKC